MALKRPDWLETALKTENARGNPQQMTVVPGLLGGARRMTYTGAGADGRIQADNPTMVDDVAYHEGELVIPAPNVKKMGGPNRAMMKIQQMEMKKSKARGYEGGGIVEDPTSAKAQMIEQRRIEEAGQVVTPPPPSVTAPVSGTVQSGKYVLPGQEEYAAKPLVDAAPVVEPSVAKQQMLTQRREEEAGGTSYTPAPYQREDREVPPPSVTTPMPAAKAAMLAARRIEESAPQPGTLSPEQFSTRNALVYKYGRNLTAEEEQKLVNSSVTDLEQWLITEGLKKPAGQEGAVAGGQDQNIATATNLMKGFATGTSDVFQRQANMAFQNLDARLQTSLISTAMRIASMPNLTDGARRTMMAEEIRNGGIAQSTLAGTLADQVMQTAMQATGQLYSMGTGERAFRVGQQTAAMEEALAAGDIDGYAKIAKDLYGINVDTTALKGTQALKNVAAANEFIYTALATDRTANLGTAGIRSSLQKLWDEQHPGQPMDEQWATDTLNHMRETTSEAWQYMQGVDNDAALGLFGGDQARVDNFTYGQYKGIDAVQHAMYGFLTGGAFKLDGNGWMDFNENNVMYQEMCKTFGWTAPASVTGTVTNTDGSTTTTYSDGSTKTTNNDVVVSSTPASSTVSTATTGNSTAKRAAIAASNAGTGKVYKSGIESPKRTINGAGGTWYNPKGEVFDKNGDALVGAKGNQLVRQKDGTIIDPSTGVLWEIGADGVETMKTVTMDGKDWGVVKTEDFPNWMVLKDGEENTAYRMNYFDPSTNKTVDKLFSLDQLLEDAKYNPHYEMDTTENANIVKMLEKQGVPTTAIENFIKLTDPAIAQLAILMFPNTKVIEGTGTPEEKATRMLLKLWENGYRLTHDQILETIRVIQKG